MDVPVLAVRPDTQEIHAQVMDKYLPNLVRIARAGKRPLKNLFQFDLMLVELRPHVPQATFGKQARQLTNRQGSHMGRIVMDPIFWTTQ